MKSFKIVFKLNSRWCASVFHYANESEKQEKLKLWKAEHVNAYDKLEVISFDEDYLPENLQLTE
jgi:hypothetical protein